jgi:hypothetical protein
MFLGALEVEEGVEKPRQNFRGLAAASQEPAPRNPRRLMRRGGPFDGGGFMGSICFDGFCQLLGLIGSEAGGEALAE